MLRHGLRHGIEPFRHNKPALALGTLGWSNRLGYWCLSYFFPFFFCLFFFLLFPFFFLYFFIFLFSFLVFTLYPKYMKFLPKHNCDIPLKKSTKSTLIQTSKNGNRWKKRLRIILHKKHFLFFPIPSFNISWQGRLVRRGIKPAG